MSEKTLTDPTPLFSNRLYDRLKYVALVVLPALSALYFGLGNVWGLPKVEEVIGTIAVLDTVLGMLLRKSNQDYKSSDARFDGHIDVVDDEGDKTFSVNVGAKPEEVLEKKEEITLKVNPEVISTEAVIAEPTKPKKRAPRKNV